MIIHAFITSRFHFCNVNLLTTIGTCCSRVCADKTGHFKAMRREWGHLLDSIEEADVVRGFSISALRQVCTDFYVEGRSEQS